MVATVVTPVIKATEALPGPTVVGAGFMGWFGFNELLEQRRVAIGLRFTGAAVVMLGLILQIL